MQHLEFNPQTSLSYFELSKQLSSASPQQLPKDANYFHFCQSLIWKLKSWDFKLHAEMLPLSGASWQVAALRAFVLLRYVWIACQARQGHQPKMWSRMLWRPDMRIASWSLPKVLATWGPPEWLGAQALKSSCQKGPGCCGSVHLPQRQRSNS